MIMSYFPLVYPFGIMNINENCVVMNIEVSEIEINKCKILS